MISFYNSLTKKKEQFEPISDGKVKMYTCGPTVYDFSHIGNFRTFLFEDLLKRVFIAFGFEVDHVMNITDVDDKTIKRSVIEKKELKDVTSHYTEAFIKDIKSLRILEADTYPNATDHIDEMIEMIENLIKKGHAYQIDDGSVFFKIDTFSKYGALVNIEKSNISNNLEISDEYSADNANDFALWKSYKEEDGKTYWNSPWGRGRPGWHIECSAMSVKYLGSHFDIHCGGVDNKFPHHENELAQSCCALDSPFVNYWLHSEFLMVDGNKMSKSLNNFYVLSDLFDAGFEPEEFKKFNACLANDLDTPGALAIFFDWIRKINSLLDQNKLSAEDIARGNSFISFFDSIFAILPQKEIIPPEIAALAEKREQYRINRDWAGSDKIRSEIESKGWLIKDTVNGPKLSKNS